MRTEKEIITELKVMRTEKEIITELKVMIDYNKKEYDFYVKQRNHSTARYYEGRLYSFVETLNFIEGMDRFKNILNSALAKQSTSQSNCVSVLLDKEQLEQLMWQYCREIGSDDITGLHVCDNFKMWMVNKLMDVYYT